MHFLRTISRWLAIYIFLHVSAVEEVEGLKKRINFQPTFMPADEVIGYFKSFFAKSSSMDRANEDFYVSADYTEDLFNKIDNFMPLPMYLKWLLKTKEILDKGGDKKGSVLSKYAGSINSPCHPHTIFNLTLQQILATWDGERTIVSNELDDWHKKNEKTIPNQLCNRYKGLTCQHKLASDPENDQGLTFVVSTNSTCQCGGDPEKIGFYKEPLVTANQKSTVAQGPVYPEGCYVRPWRACKHLSGVDLPFKSNYAKWHSSLDNERRVLAQMIFPVPRTHRCRQGTYCLDMVPGMKKPICWCTPTSQDVECHSATSHERSDSTFRVPPLGSELMQIRTRFTRMIIPMNHTSHQCNPEYNKEIKKLTASAGLNPTKTGALEIMKDLVEKKETKDIKICDFREALTCDEGTKTCRGNLNCGPGRVHLGKGVCAINNGFRCQSNEDCVQNAECKFFKEISDSACVCLSGYGDLCRLENKPFFGNRFLPLVSGLQDEEYLKTQVEIYKVLESWEDAMTRKIGETCEISLEKDSMKIVNYFGDLGKYNPEQGESVVAMAKRISRDGKGQLCSYKDFLRCEKGKCVPIYGKKIVSTGSHHVGDNKIIVEVEKNDDCLPTLPKIFSEVVVISCKIGYMCQYNGMKWICVVDCDSQYAPAKDCSKLKRTAHLQKSSSGGRKQGQDPVTNESKLPTQLGFLQPRQDNIADEPVADGDTSDSPGATGDDTSASPATTGDDTSASSGATGDDTSASPGATGDDTSATPGTTGDDTSASPGATGDDTSVTPGDDTVSTPGATGDDTSASSGATGDDISASPGATGDDTSATPGTIGDDTSASPGATGDDTSVTPGDDTVSTPGATGDDTSATPGAPGDNDGDNGDTTGDDTGTSTESDSSENSSAQGGSDDFCDICRRFCRIETRGFLKAGQISSKQNPVEGQDDLSTSSSSSSDTTEALVDPSTSSSSATTETLVDPSTTSSSATTEGQDDSLASPATTEPQGTSSASSQTDKPTSLDCGKCREVCNEKPPAPEPPPPSFNSPLSYGSPCSTNDDMCRKESFLSCQNKGNGLKCECVKDLMPPEHKTGPCTLRYDQDCSNLKAYESGNIDSPLPRCYNLGSCTEVNGGKFCRPASYIGSIFVDGSRANEIRRQFNESGSNGNKNGAANGCVVLSIAVVTSALATYSTKLQLS